MLNKALQILALSLLGTGGAYVLWANDPALVGTPWPISPSPPPPPLMGGNAARLPEWLPSNSKLVRESSARRLSLDLQPGPGVVWQTRPLGDDWEFSFVWERQSALRLERIAPEGLTLAIGLDTKNGQAGGRLVLTGAKASWNPEGGPGLDLPVPGTGRWRVLWRDGSLRLERDGRLAGRFTLEQKPALWWEIPGTGRGNPAEEILLDGLRLSTGASRAEWVWWQWELETFPGQGRLMTVLAPAALAPENPLQLGYLPLLHQALETYTGAVLGPWNPRGTSGDPVVMLWEDDSGGRNGPWVYIPTRTAGLTQTAAHELAHHWGALTSDAVWTRETWLFEGIADFLANKALNQVGGRPASFFYSHFGHDWTRTFEDMPLGPDGFSRGADWTGQSYIKGHHFLWYLEEIVGPETFARFLRREQRPQGGGEGWVRALGAAAGKDLAYLLPGWVNPGAYAEGPPFRPGGTHEDVWGIGLMGYQVKNWKLAPDTWGSWAAKESPGLWPVVRGAYLEGIPELNPTDNVLEAPAAVGAAPTGWGWLWGSASRVPGAGLLVQGERRSQNPWAPWAEITMVIVEFHSGERLKITWKSEGLNEAEWLGGRGGRISGSGILYQESRFGFEALIPQEILGTRVPQGVYLSRGGWNEGSWSSEELGTVRMR